MKAVGVTAPDFMPRLFDIDEPIAGPGEVVVEVMAASVNDVDRAAVGGSEGVRAKDPDRVVLGHDFVGRVAGVGRGVGYLAVGTLVAGAFGPLEVGFPGTFAEKVAVPAGLVAPVPAGIDLAHAAGVGLAGVTALDAVNALGVAGLGRMVIHGPVTGVGGFALQLAKAHGAVVTLITNPAHAALARELGADVVITEASLPAQTIHEVRSRFGNVDTAIHIEGDPSVVAALFRPGGKFTSVARLSSATPSAAGYVTTNVAPSGHKLADLLFRVASRRLRSYVRHAVSFERIGDAMTLDGAHTAGRVVVIR
jgi:NADPH:quinone reductase-like Zn-dependent oxidoreductase